MTFLTPKPMDEILSPFNPFQTIPTLFILQTLFVSLAFFNIKGSGF